MIASFISKLKRKVKYNGKEEISTIETKKHWIENTI